MRILICNSKKWFELNAEISTNHLVNEISCKEDLNTTLLEELQPDIIFFTHWNWIVESEIHENFECIVFHTAPLPYGRGGSPIQNLIIEGFKSSPVCAIRMTSDLDAGPIYSSFNVSLQGDLSSIFSRINGAINTLIFDIITNKPLPTPQIGKPHYFKRLTTSDNEIPLGLSLERIYDRVRMIDDPDYPNSFIIFGDSKIEFFNASLRNNSLELRCKITKLR